MRRLRERPTSLRPRQRRPGNSQYSEWSLWPAIRPRERCPRILYRRQQNRERHPGRRYGQYRGDGGVFGGMQGERHVCEEKISGLRREMVLHCGWTSQRLERVFV